MADQVQERNGHFRLRVLGSELELTGAVALKLGGWALALVAVFGGGVAGAYAAFGKPQQILDRIVEVQGVQARQAEALASLSATASALGVQVEALRGEMRFWRRSVAGRDAGMPFGSASPNETAGAVP